MTLAVVETARPTLAKQKPTPVDVDALFELGRTIRQQQASRHPIEARTFREFLTTAQIGPAKALVLELGARGKRRAVA